jgi:putative transposase
VFNRGVDKRKIFLDQQDLERFFQSMKEFNTLEPIGSIYENSFRKNSKLGDPISKFPKLVDFICYCLNPNHYHFILKQNIDNGIEKFMHRLGIGYTMFFNKENERSGALFQGRYKAIHIDSNEYLLHLSAYVNLNERIHELGDSISKSSWKQMKKLLLE